MDIETLKTQHPEHWLRAAAIRTLTLDAVAAANSGHSGMPMGMADVATVLFSKHLKFDAAAPDWWDRDRFVLSAGHGSMLLYALLYLTGYPGMTLDELKNFRQLGAKTAGHPEYGHAPGIETTTGPLGQGIANAVGMAIAEENLRARFSKSAIQHDTYVIAGDGCLMEGISQEAMTLAGNLRLGRLIVLFDDNGITIDGPVSLSDKTDQKRRFNASGWHVAECDGHDPEAIDAAIQAAKASQRPALIACKTHIALGSSAQDTAKGHGALTDPQLIADTKAAYGLDWAPFDIPADIKAWWEEVGRSGAGERAAWQARIDAMGAARQNTIKRIFSGEAPPKLRGAIRKLKKGLAEEAPKLATRKASETVLDAINPQMPETIGGSADLTGSNNTKAGGIEPFSTSQRKGRYVHFGVREHAMAAAMNGMALHGGLRPYGGTFLCFTDYARGAMRLSALMGLPVTYVMTHDSIGLGEDGPTHQPVEHLAMLRATPNMTVIRPADAVETAEAWEIALTSDKTPTVLALSRQGLPAVRRDHTAQNATALGAYVLAKNDGALQAVLIASGSEVHLALQAREVLQADGIGTRVVSMPSMELFAAQDEGYRRRVLPGGAVRIGIEAGVGFGWDRWLTGERGRDSKAAFVGMEGFGASAPADTLFQHFGITPEAIVEAAHELL